MHIIRLSFAGDTVEVIEKQGELLVALNGIATNFGLRWAPQQNRLLRDEVIRSSCFIIRTVTNERENVSQLFLPLKFLNSWLFSFNEQKIRPAASRKKLLLYKREAYDFLFKHWLAEQQSHLQVVNAALDLYKVQENIASQSGRTLCRWKNVKRHLLTTLKSLKNEPTLLK